MTKEIYIVIGTRAQLIKMAPLMYLFETEKVPYTFIYTAQHTETIDAILKSFKIKRPDRILYDREEANTIFKFLGWAEKMFGYLFVPKKIFPKKGIVITHGDTATCVWAAIAGKIAGCKVAHVESGLRSYNLLNPFPEELMRLVTFRFADIYFCPNKWALDNIKKYRGVKIDTKGNTLVDCIKLALNKGDIAKLPHSPYVVVSIHRYENIYSKRFTEIIIPYIEDILKKNLEVVFVQHPSTREVLNKKYKTEKARLDQNKNLSFKKRYDYFDFIKLLYKSEFVVTDGGSNQEELSYLGKPTILMRKATERIEGLNRNIIISNYDPKIMNDFIINYKKYNRSKNISKNSPSQIIFSSLMQNEI